MFIHRIAWKPPGSWLPPCRRSLLLLHLLFVLMPMLLPCSCTKGRCSTRNLLATVLLLLGLVAYIRAGALGLVAIQRENLMVRDCRRTAGATTAAVGGFDGCLRCTRPS